MADLGASVAELLHAVRAGVRLLFGVRAFVLQLVTVLVERPRAVGAGERPLVGVHPLVNHLAVLAGEGLAAEGADEGARLQVGTLVHLLLATRGEHTGAEGAREARGQRTLLVSSAAGNVQPRGHSWPRREVRQVHLYSCKEEGARCCFVHFAATARFRAFVFLLTIEAPIDNQ